MKDLINKIIEDLGNDKPINGILLKAKIVAEKLDNQDFKDWIYNEQNGYPTPQNIPDYRILNACVKADIFRPFVGLIQNYPIPTGIFHDDTIDYHLNHIHFTLSLPHIENICDVPKENCLSLDCPVAIYPEINKFINDGKVQKVWQEFPVHSVLNIINIFKSKLLDFFLNLDKQIDAGIDFSTIDKQKEINQIMNNYYISSVVANTGNGSVNTGEISGNNPTLYISDPETKKQINDLVSQLLKETEQVDNADLKMAIKTINMECQKPSWTKSTLKLAFNAIKGIATGITANQLTPIVSKALTLL